MTVDLDKLEELHVPLSVQLARQQRDRGNAMDEPIFTAMAVLETWDAALNAHSGLPGLYRELSGIVDGVTERAEIAEAKLSSALAEIERLKERLKVKIVPREPFVFNDDAALQPTSGEVEE